MILLFAFAIGVIAGLRAMTAPAVVSLAAHFKWIDLHDSKLAFLESIVTTGILCLLAMVELFTDKLPKTPNRTSPVQLAARIITGGFSGAALCASANQSLLIGAVVGAIGAIVGTFAGYQLRHRLVQQLKVPDFVIAVIEDVVAVGGALLIVSQV